MSKPDGGPATCKWCAEPSFRKQGRIWLCVKHYRFQVMRTTAQRRGVSVPSYETMDDILPEDMACPGCARTMVWTQAEDRSRVLSLQHDRSGRILFLCRSCNTRHAHHDGDSFYDVPGGHKRCPGCNKALPYSDFTKDSRKFLGLKTYCRECSNERHREWARKNRERLSREQRERRAAR